jgi:hypothetical protein
MARSGELPKEQCFSYSFSERLTPKRCLAFHIKWPKGFCFIHAFNSTPDNHFPVWKLWGYFWDSHRKHNPEAASNYKEQHWTEASTNLWILIRKTARIAYQSLCKICCWNTTQMSIQIFNAMNSCHGNSTDKAGRSDNDSDLYSWHSWFESQLGHRMFASDLFFTNILCWLKFKLSNLKRNVTHSIHLRSMVTFIRASKAI